MHGQMMDTQLTITAIMAHADKVFGDTEIVSVTADNPRHRYTYRDAFRRTRQLANALAEFGLQPGDRIATMAWNDYRHFELYYAISCSGYVCHTINPRLFAEQISFIINHAEDQWLFVDPMFVPLLEQLQDQLPTVRGFVVLTDAAHMPATQLRNVHCYETLIARQPEQFAWPELDERAASSMCYTSGTTGNPKGAVYSHRSTVLHAMMCSTRSVMNPGPDSVVLPVVPMFHVNAWGTVYNCPMMGSKLVLPGPKMGDGATLTDLINAEKVTFALGVPTVWLALLQYLDKTGETLPSLKNVGAGGSAMPISLIRQLEQRGVWVNIGWGMTEMSPVGVFNTELAQTRDLPEEARHRMIAKAGRKIFGVDLKIVDDNNNELPWDGVTSGALKVRGPWVISGYYNLAENPVDSDGWLETGDVAAIDAKGYLTITDRTKDVIKSGGEWVSSIDVENAAMLHPAVVEAAVIGIPHPKWTERPLLIVVPKEGVVADKRDILKSLEGKIAKWWIPEECVFVDQIPHTATGKVSKKDLRKQFIEAT